MNLYYLLQGDKIIAWGTKTKMKEQLESIIRTKKRGESFLYSYSIILKENSINNNLA